MLVCRLMMYGCWFCMHVELLCMLSWKDIGCIGNIIIIMSFRNSWKKNNSLLYSFVKTNYWKYVKGLKDVVGKDVLEKLGLNPSMWMPWFSMGEWDMWSACIITYMFIESFSMWYGLLAIFTSWTYIYQEKQWPNLNYSMMTLACILWECVITVRLRFN